MIRTLFSSSFLEIFFISKEKSKEWLTKLQGKNLLTRASAGLDAGGGMLINMWKCLWAFVNIFTNLSDFMCT